MVEIEIQSPDVKVYKGKEGKPDRRVQVAMVEYHNGERRRWEIGLNRDQPPHAAGRYTLAPGDFYAGKYGPEVSGWPKLQPVTPAKPRA